MGKNEKHDVERLPIVPLRVLRKNGKKPGGHHEKIPHVGYFWLLDVQSNDLPD